MTYAEFIQSLLHELERQRQYYKKTQKEVSADLEITLSQYGHIMNGTRKPGSELIDKILTYLNCSVELINHKQAEKYYHSIAYQTEELIVYGIRYSIHPLSVVRVEDNKDLHRDIYFQDKLFDDLQALIRYTEAWMCDLPQHFGEIQPLSLIPDRYHQYRFDIVENSKLETYFWLKEEVIPAVCQKLKLETETIGKVIYAAGYYFLVDKTRLDLYYAEPRDLSLHEDILFTIRYFLNNATKDFTETQIN